MKQRSIRTPISISGTGLHTQQAVNVELLPASPDFGIKFERPDVAEGALIAADVLRVLSTERCTVIGNAEFRISTIEHLLSACAGLGIQNLHVKVIGDELPILDGSAIQWVQLIEEAGIEEQDVDVTYLTLIEPIHFKDEASGSEYWAMPSETLELRVNIDFDSKVLMPQHATWGEGFDFKKEIAPSRTFVFLHDVIKLLQHGLIKGGSLDNAVLITEFVPESDQLDLLRKYFPGQEDEVVKPGIYAKDGLIFNNEAARHKLLDLLGDLQLVNGSIRAMVIAHKPSHQGNVAFAKVLKNYFREQSKAGGYVDYDPNKEPLYNVEQIQAILPHRHPFLLVDKIIEEGDNYVVGIKNISINESYFQGHFPGNAIFPGVLQLEALAQTGGILAISLMPKGFDYDTYFLKIDNAKFKKKVVPGDTLILKMELMEPVRRGICKMKGTAFVGRTVVAEGELTAQMVARS